jgi:cation:H+ antiporter
MVFVGAKAIVDNVVWTANYFNIPNGLIAATVIAFGTSVPELAVTLSGVYKKKHDIALGNIIGSCIFNIVLVLGISSVIMPLRSSVEMQFMSLLMLITGGLLLFALYTGRKFSRAEGIFFLIIYLFFLGYNISKAVQL